MNPLIAVGLVFAAIVVLSGATTAGTAERLKYLIKDISFSMQGLFQIQVSITIGIQNPTGNTFTIHSMAADLVVNGTVIGNVSNFTPTTIAANSETPYTVSVLLNSLGIPNTILDLIQNFKGAKVQLDGTINADGLSIPLNIEKSF